MTSWELDLILKELKRYPAQWQPKLTRIGMKSPKDRKKLLGLSPDASMLTQIKRLNLDKPIRRMFKQKKSGKSNPGYCNWRTAHKKNWLTPIKDQGDCGSCVAFGILAALESRQKIHWYGTGGLTPNLSEAHLFFCGCGNCCEYGWQISLGLDYVKEQGVPPESCFPYQDHDMPCLNTCNNWEKKSESNKIEKWNHTYTIKTMKKWLRREGPLVGGMAVYTDFFFYSSGIYEYVYGELEGLHAIAIIGYNDEQEYWICKNSWGTDWGETGWFRIAYGESGLESFGMWSMVPRLVLNAILFVQIPVEI